MPARWSRLWRSAYFEDELRVARAMRENLAANLAKLEHGSRPEEIAEARAQTAAKEATLAQARSDYARYKELEKTPGAVSKQDLAKYAAQLAVAEADAKYAHESQRLMEIGPRKEDIAAARALLAQEEAVIMQIERKLGRLQPGGAQRRNHPHAIARDRGDRSGRRHRLHAHPDHAGLGAHLRE